MGMRFTILVGMILALVLGLFAAPAAGAPPVSWTPSFLEETVVAGETLTVPVTFTASRNLSDVVVRVAPELADVVVVSPDALGDVQKGETRELNVVMAPAVTLSPEVLDGAIQLRHSGHPPKVYAKPLPTTVVVQWPSASIDGVSFSHPATWQAEVIEGDEQLESTVVLTSPMGSRLVILPEGGFAYGFDPSVERLDTMLTINGFPAIRGDYLAPDGSVNVSRIVFDPPIAERPAFRLDLRADPEDLTAEEAFDEILDSLELE